MVLKYYVFVLYQKPTIYQFIIGVETINYTISYGNIQNVDINLRILSFY